MAVTDIFGQSNPTDDPLQQQELIRQLRASAAANGTPTSTVGSPAAPVAAGAVPSQSQALSYSYTPPAAGTDLSANAKENHASQIGALSSAASGASTGATIGSVVPVLGTLAGAGIGAGIGALSGYLKGRTNDTKNERETFAQQQLGVPDTTALWSKLDAALPPQEAQELKDRALNRIGKHDETANAQWMQDVQTALMNSELTKALGGTTGGAAAGTPTSAPGAAGAAAGTSGATTATAAGASPAAGSFQTRLMEGDPSKLADPSHAANSPKYDFLQLAQQGKYNYDQMPQMLQQLQSGPNGRLWKGWTADGKGNFVFTGSPSDLAPEWNGVTRVDAVGSYGNMAQGKQPQGWRWGVDDPNAPQGGQSASPRGVPGSYTGALGINGLVPTDTGFYNTLQSKIADILGGPSVFDRDALIQQLTQGQ